MFIFIIPLLWLGFHIHPTQVQLQDATGLQVVSGNVQDANFQVQDNALDVQAMYESGGITIYGADAYGVSSYGQ